MEIVEDRLPVAFTGLADVFDAPEPPAPKKRKRSGEQAPRSVGVAPLTLASSKAMAAELPLTMRRPDEPGTQDNGFYKQRALSYRGYHGHFLTEGWQ